MFADVVFDGAESTILVGKPMDGSGYICVSPTRFRAFTRYQYVLFGATVVSSYVTIVPWPAAAIPDPVNCRRKQPATEKLRKWFGSYQKLNVIPTRCKLPKSCN